jgi:hypothetical protein
VHPRTEELLAYLDDCAAEFDAAWNAVAPADRARKPGADAWSPAQIVEHVGTLERLVAGLLGKRVAEARQAGLPAETDTGSVLDSVNRARIVDRARKVVAGEAVRPAVDTDPARAVTAWREGHSALLALVRTADGLALGTLSHPHPALGVINFYQWIVFSGAHELRHAEQLREAAAVA